MYIVKVNEPNKFFTIKGKDVRSPFIIKVSDADIKRIKSIIKVYGIIDYEIEYEDDSIKEKSIIQESKKNESIELEEKKNIENINLNKVELISLNDKPKFTRKKKKKEDNKSSIEEIKIKDLSYKTSKILEDLLKNEKT